MSFFIFFKVLTTISNHSKSSMIIEEIFGIIEHIVIEPSTFLIMGSGFDSNNIKDFDMDRKDEIDLVSNIYYSIFSLELKLAL